VFNTRKMSPVFTPGAEAEVPPVFVDRFGAKAWTSHTGEEQRARGACCVMLHSGVCYVRVCV
jgi:hypothetical protein